MATFGTPGSKSDDEVLETFHLWNRRERELIQDREPDLARQARNAAEEYRAEAERRGLL
ncbi:hypothetical protein [Rhodococcoides fascians]|uniref:hypothetical protein n=1 Tax=Rhodococcoides fascians TaxID=1828 RepID=UPI001E414A56|nr:hypothetical protein [Rhodococcus fascians]